MVSIQPISPKTKEDYRRSICLGCQFGYELYPGLIGCEQGNYPSTRRRRCKFNPNALRATPAVSMYPTISEDRQKQCRGSQGKVFTPYTKGGD
jgi:hypothetical protein